MGLGSGGTTSGYGTGTMTQTGGRGKRKLSRPIDTKTQSITYSASDNSLLLDISSAASESASLSGQVSAVRVKNNGYVPANAIFAYTKYVSDSDTSEAVEYVQYLLNPGDEITLPASRAIITTTNEQYDGTPITATAPDANEYVASGALTTEGFADDNDTTITFDDGSAGAANKLFQVNDLIRLDDEICRVTSIVDTAADGDYTPANFIVERGVHGSTKADHTNNTAIRLPFFNAYHDFDKYTLAQTDSLGRWKSMNFFGYGRSASGIAGITPGSVAIQFYSQGYQKFGMSGITANSKTGLTASTEYGFDVSVDGSNLTSDYMKFTTDANNNTWGGSTGVIAKMQNILDTQFYTHGSNLLNKRATVRIEGGDIVFRSGSFLSTSAILLAAPSAGETTPFGVGRVTAIGSVESPVAAKLESETTTDRITNASTYKQIFIRDDGNGNLIWKNRRKVGVINYETGAIEWTISELPNAEFVVSVLHTSPFSGKLYSHSVAADNRGNSLKQVFGNTPQQKCEAKLTVKTY